MAYANYVEDMEINSTTYGVRDKDHRADTVSHITASERSSWTNHVASTDVHVTTSDKTAWNAKLDTDDYASQTTGGTVKAWLDGTTLYIKTQD